jgi:putative ferrous iron transport protein C
MTLIEIKQHMKQVRMATLGSLCSLFQVEPDTIRCMMSHWVRKGSVRQCTKEPACGSRCFKCPATTTEVYEWIEGAII